MSEIIRLQKQIVNAALYDMSRDKLHSMILAGMDLMVPPSFVEAELVRRFEKLSKSHERASHLIGQLKATINELETENDQLRARLNDTSAAPKVPMNILEQIFAEMFGDGPVQTIDKEAPQADFRVDSNGTATGRFTSTAPNFEEVPKKRRHLFYFQDLDELKTLTAEKLESLLAFLEAKGITVEDLLEPMTDEEVLLMKDNGLTVHQAAQAITGTYLLGTVLTEYLNFRDQPVNTENAFVRDIEENDFDAFERFVPEAMAQLGTTDISDIGVDVMINFDTDQVRTAARQTLPVDTIEGLTYIFDRFGIQSQINPGDAGGVQMILTFSDIRHPKVFFETAKNNGVGEEAIYNFVVNHRN